MYNQLQDWWSGSLVLLGHAACRFAISWAVELIQQGQISALFNLHLVQLLWQRLFWCQPFVPKACWCLAGTVFHVNVTYLLFMFCMGNWQTNHEICSFSYPQFFCICHECMLTVIWFYYSLCAVVYICLSFCLNAFQTLNPFNDVDRGLTRFAPEHSRGSSWFFFNWFVTWDVDVPECQSSIL